MASGAEIREAAQAKIGAGNGYYSNAVLVDHGRPGVRTHLRHHDNILKRLLIHVAGFNLSLIMRKLFGIGTARRLPDLAGLARHGFQELWWYREAIVRHLVPSQAATDGPDTALTPVVLFSGAAGARSAKRPLPRADNVGKMDNSAVKLPRLAVVARSLKNKENTV